MKNRTGQCFEENNCFTFLSKRQLIDERHLLAIGVVSFMLIPFAVVTNTALLVYFSKNRVFPNNFRSLLKILASADFLVGVVVLPLFSVVLIFHPHTCNCALELVCQFAAAFLAGTSGRTTGMIAFDRFIHIRYSTYYPTLLTPRYKAITHSLGVITSLCVAVSTTVGTMFDRYPLICGTVTVFDFSVLASVVFLYLSAWKSVNRHVRTSVVWQTMSKRPRYDLVLAKKVTGILIVLNICYGPFVVTNFLRSFFDDHFQGSTLILINLWSYNILFANSILNAVILLRKDSRLRKSTPYNQHIQVIPMQSRHSSQKRSLVQQRKVNSKKSSSKSRSIGAESRVGPTFEIAVIGRAARVVKTTCDK